MAADFRIGHLPIPFTLVVWPGVPGVYRELQVALLLWLDL